MSSGRVRRQSPARRRTFNVLLHDYFSSHASMLAAMKGKAARRGERSGVRARAVQPDVVNASRASPIEIHVMRDSRVVDERYGRSGGHCQRCRCERACKKANRSAWTIIAPATATAATTTTTTTTTATLHVGTCASTSTRARCHNRDHCDYHDTNSFHETPRQGHEDGCIWPPLR